MVLVLVLVLVLLLLLLLLVIIRLVGVLGAGEGSEFLTRFGFFTGVDVENKTRLEVPVIGLEGVTDRETTIE